MNWWSELEGEINNIKAWANAKNTSDVQGTFICGDFNTKAGTDGYNYIMSDSSYADSYFVANPSGFSDPTIGSADEFGERIDYIFMKQNSAFQVLMGQRIFTENIYGRVSDHNGQYARFKKN